jgi:hypothetical protein
VVSLAVSPKRVAVGALTILAVASAAGWAATRGDPSAADVAPILDGPAQPSDELPDGVDAPKMGLNASSSRLLLRVPGASQWVVEDEGGNVCSVTTIAARPNEVRGGVRRRRKSPTKQYAMSGLSASRRFLNLLAHGTA